MDSVLTEMSELDTPALVVDLDVVKSNLARMARAARAKGVKLRPHIKTHKSLYFTAMQLEHGASGITVAKLGEAEVMAGGGVDDVLLAYPPIGEVKLKRLAGLLEQTRVIVSVDSVEAAEGLSRLARRLATSIEVYIDVDTGLGRMGLPPGGPTVRLAEAVARLHGLEVIGLMSHCGHVSRAKDRHELARIAKADAEALVETADVLRQRGLPVREVSQAPHWRPPFISTSTG